MIGGGGQREMRGGAGESRWRSQEVEVRAGAGKMRWSSEGVQVREGGVHRSGVQWEWR